MTKLQRPVGRLGNQRPCSVFWRICATRGFRMTCNPNSMSTTEGRYWAICKFSKGFPDSPRALRWSTPSESSSGLWPGSGSSPDTLQCVCHCLWWWWRWSLKLEGGPVLFLQPCISEVAPSSPYEARASQCHPAPYQPQSTGCVWFCGTCHQATVRRFSAPSALQKRG